MNNRTKIYSEKLSLLIQAETISSLGNQDLTKFRQFHTILKKQFPRLFAVCNAEDFEGSLMLCWQGKGVSKPQPIMFMNHHDVVEATGEWTYPPFSGQIAEGKLWGRGTLDTKGGLWAMMQAADELAAEGFIPSRDIYFVSTCTEETTGAGAAAIVSALEARGIHFEMLFDEGGMIMHDPIGGADGTFAMVGMGEKGCCDLRFTAKSNGGHASTPGKNTPLVRLGKFMAEVERTNPFKKEINPVIKEMFRRFSAYMGPLGFVMGHPDLFSKLIKAAVPKISTTAGAMFQTTLAFTMAKGSAGTNVLPQEAYVIGNMRFSHHQDRDASIAVLKPIADKYNIEIEILEGGQKSGLADFRSNGFSCIEKALKVACPKVDGAVPYIMTGGSDSRFFDKISDNCFRFLPFLITQQQMESIHGIDENIDLETLAPAVDYYRALIKEVNYA